MAGPRYWHPYYGPARPKRVWNDIGYTYYVGGTSYVVSSSIAVPAEPVGNIQSQKIDSSEHRAGDAGQRYDEILELADLIHEWRTMNESSAVHDRIPPSNSPGRLTAVVAEIRTANQGFDSTTRSAMSALAEGRSAAAELDRARGCLAKLTELVESLPASANDRSAPLQDTQSASGP